MEGNELQQAFFNYVKSKIPSHFSLVDEVADILNISTDSAYRRIRGEKIISLEEISKLAVHFKISLDQVLNLKVTDFVVFSGKYVRPETFDFDKFLRQLLTDLTFLNSFKNRELIYFCKDMVVFYFFAYPELAAFKNFAWMKTLLQFPSFAHKQFDYNVFEKSLIDLGSKVIRQYIDIPSTEIMNVSNIHTTLYQIEYYKTARLFRSEQDLQIIYKQLHDVVDHLQAQAETGQKFMPGGQANSQSAAFNLYVNDFVVGDNSNLAIIEGTKMSYIVHNHVNYLSTTDETHTAYHYNFLKNVMEKSILLSKSGERLRAGFFYMIHEEIEKSQANQLKSFGKY
ncbi:MAG TPA: helix-turn-helix domain-containing protein [Chitinophagaceae bacterium]|nr:helix-turn-helix domain-containing protein [Chitinophagaceae bacterium]